MNPPDERPAGGTGPATSDDDLTGLPGLRSWRGVYVFVFGCFILWVVLLTLLTGFFR